MMAIRGRDSVIECLLLFVSLLKTPCNLLSGIISKQSLRESPSNSSVTFFVCCRQTEIQALLFIFLAELRWGSRPGIRNEQNNEKATFAPTPVVESTVEYSHA